MQQTAAGHILAELHTAFDHKFKVVLMVACLHILAVCWLMLWVEVICSRAPHVQGHLHNYI